MTSYTEDEIRYALRGRTDLSDEHLLKVLRNNRTKADMHAIWADSDTVTVKELRDAEKKQGSMLYSVDQLLEAIEDSREPEYPYASVWKDDNGINWFRCSDKTWMRFGYRERFRHAEPKRPLKRMDVL